MQIDSNARVVRLSVGELAAFRNSSPHSSKRNSSGRWRAGIGQKWHKTIEERTKAIYPDTQFELPIHATWQHKDWTLEISGRLDQLIFETHSHRIIEVKTVRHPLPDDADLLAQRYPEYFAQASIYLNILKILPDYANQPIQAELLFIDIDTETVQSVSIDKDHETLFENQLSALTPFLEDRRNAKLRLQTFELQPAFAQLREGQEALFTTLKKAALKARTVLLEAPTGFGKTGIVLEHALTQMQNGLYERCIYLTSKSTGQLETIHQLRKMIGNNVRYLQMRNRSEHSIDSLRHSCSEDERCDSEIGQRWMEAALQPETLFENGTFNLESAKELGAESGICPYALTKACLPFSEIWIGDSNYIFSPASRAVFTDPYGFNPKTTLLVIDEAHNLPDRTANALSVELNTQDLFFAINALDEAGTPKRLLSIGRELIRHIESLPLNRPIDGNSVYTLLDLSEDFTENLQNTPLDWEAISPFALDIIWRIPDLAHRLNEPSHNWLFWCSEIGAFRATCLDARGWIKECLSPFGGNILMSATLSPIESFRESCDLKADQTTIAIGHAPWREEAYTVGIDLRVDTRFKQREKHYETTARTVATLVAESPGVPVAVFFASYQYAKDIAAYLDAIEPNIRVRIQPRSVDLKEQKTFLEEGLLMADVLFLILGSSYAEGVDTLGGRIQTAMIVGPALPEVNAIQTAKIEAHPNLNREIAFNNVYIVPAMRRIHQALGRIVRAPTHTARVLLHGKRFAEPAYRQQLADEHQNATEIQNETQLHHWLIK